MLYRGIDFFFYQRENGENLLILSRLEVIRQIVIVFLHLLGMTIIRLFFVMLITMCILCILAPFLLFIVQPYLNSFVFPFFFCP